MELYLKLLLKETDFLLELLSLTIRLCPSIWRPSVSLSVYNFFVKALASTNINQSASNLVKMYITIRSQMTSIMELIEPELSELSALELENLPYLTLFTF